MRQDLRLLGTRRLRNIAASRYVNVIYPVLVAGLCRHYKHDVDNVGDAVLHPGATPRGLLLQSHGDDGVRALLHQGLDQDIGGLRFLLPHDHDPDVLLRVGLPRQQTPVEEVRVQYHRQSGRLRRGQHREGKKLGN